MSAKNDDFTMGLDHLTALFAWWGIPTGNANGEIDAQMKRFQDLVTGLQKAQSEAYHRQVTALYDTSQRVGASLQAFPRCRKPDEVVAAGSTIVATILEGATLQAQAWIDFAQELQDCYAALNRAPAAERPNRTAGPGHRVEPAKAEESEVKTAKATAPSKRDMEGSAAPRAAESA